MVRHHHRIASAAALAATLAAAAPASARLELNAVSTPPAPTASHTRVCSEVCSAGGYRTSITSTDPSAERGATLPHNPHAVGLTPVAATSAVAAHRFTAPRSEVVSGSGYSAPAGVTVVHVSSPASSGFNWGDAGIGAGGAVVIVMLLAGGAMATTTARTRRRSGGAAQPTT
jgi:hypothetical protein